MKVIKTKIKDLLIIKQKNNIDKRGSLRETHNKKVIGHNNFVFEYCTTSKKNSLRGFHFQHKFQQAKYVSVLKGKILDCVIDLRKKSKTFGKVFKIILSEKNCLSLYIPEGFAHGYYSYNKLNIIYYKLEINFSLIIILDTSILFKANIIEGTTPPAPNIKTFLPFVLN